VAKSGLCAALGNNVFDYGHRAAADQMRTSWEKLVQFVGTNYGQDISNELQNKIPVILSEPIHTPEVLARHAIREQLEKKTYNGPAYQSESSWKLQPHLELTQMHQCNLRFWIMKSQKEITNKTMRSQSKCQIQRRCNTATIGEPTKRGMRYSLSTEGRHSLSSSVSALSCFKTE
jgi:hypothetical protein